VSGIAVRELTADDAAWAAELMEQRRQAYARYSPVFWRPAQGVTGLHERFLRRQIASPANVALRTEHGFIIGQRRGQEGFVDDFAIDEAGSWDGDGAGLLLATWHRWQTAGGADAVRVVTAHADEEKSGMLGRLSLELAAQWWVREIQPAGQARPAGQVGGAGFSGLLGPAPPVYDPGGPVLHVDDLDDDADLTAVERESAMMGAVLLIVPAVPGSARAERLSRPGWSVASDWYLGRPAAT
jgi:hypothetical protein